MRDINLIPKEYIKRKNRPRSIALTLAFIILTVSLAAYPYIAQLYKIRALEEEIGKYDEAVLLYNELQGKISKMQEIEEAIKKKTEFLEEISANEVKPTEVFEMVNNSLPKDVWLTSLHYTFSDVSLTSVAGSASGAMEFYVELSKIDKFKDVKISPIAVDQNGYSFTIQFSLGPGSDDGNESKAE